MGGIVPWAGSTYVPTFPSVPTTQLAPVPAPQSLKDWWKELHGETIRPPKRVESAIVGLRYNGEGAAMSAILAFIDTVLGGLDLGGRIPLDWVGAALFYALSVRDGNDASGLASDFRALGQSCTTVAVYRMVHRKLESKVTIPQNKSSSDPILAVGRSVDF